MLFSVRTDGHLLRPYVFWWVRKKCNQHVTAVKVTRVVADWFTDNSLKGLHLSVNLSLTIAFTGVLGRVADVINRAKFQLNPFRGFGVPGAESGISH